MSVEPFVQLGVPRAGGVLIIGDHASNRVPDSVDLGIEAALLDDHIAIDIGVREVATLLVERLSDCTAILGNVSRLVIDFNREEDRAGLIPETSDGIAISGNQDLGEGARARRLADYYRPYHDRIAACIATTGPSCILSLHSFTPSLRTEPDVARPWDIGILYNDDDRLARVAIPHLTAMGLNAGDQLPYSGKLLNATMNRHAEGNAIPYLGVEMRQDMVGDATGQAKWADILASTMEQCRNSLA